MVINSKKIQREFHLRAQRPKLGAFLRDTDGKILRIPQSRALGTTLSVVLKGMCNVSIATHLVMIGQAVTNCCNAGVYCALGNLSSIGHIMGDLATIA